MTVQVRLNPEQGHGKVLFEGTDEDARAFVVNNFPRMHSEPGIDPRPDVVLSTGAHFDGHEWKGARSSSPSSSAPRKSTARKSTTKGR